jgi:hypothetical protein
MEERALTTETTLILACAVSNWTAQAPDPTFRFEDEVLLVNCARTTKGAAEQHGEYAPAAIGDPGARCEKEERNG